jgi:hypothetical protein
MEYPVNGLSPDSSYNSAVEDASMSRISAQYIAFKKGSAALVKAFQAEIDKHGLIHNIPHDLLQKYKIPFKTLLDLSKNLRKEI